MMAEEDKERIKCAMNCDSCLEWHKYCNAECCRMIFLNIPKVVLLTEEKYIKIPSKINFDERKYYKLHDVKYSRGFLWFLRERCGFIGNEVVYFFSCKNLKNNKCIAHGKLKPGICVEMTAENIHSKKFKVTPNCLYKYKEMIKNAEKDK